MKIGVVEQAQVKDAEDNVIVTGKALRYEDARGRGIVVPIPPQYPEGEPFYDAQVLRALLTALESGN